MSPSEIFDIIEKKDNRYVFLTAAILVRVEAEKKEEKKIKKKM